VDPRRLVKVSRYLSRHLRHDPGRLGLELRPGGWVEVEALLAACAARGLALSRGELHEVVERNDKRRFALDRAGTLIRASQGHSVPVDLGLASATPPAVLWHGTSEARVEAILRDGLRPMGRHHVHLSPDAVSARRVGARHGRPTVLEVAAGKLAAAGHVFLRSDNGIWLTEHVPPRALRELSGG